jgi:Uma2 family endonuclease
MRARQREWNVRALPEQRVQVKQDRFRISDVCVISRDLPIEQILNRPPLLCAEILSKDDTLRSTQDRVDDNLAFGVPNIWVLDPVKRRAYVCSGQGFLEPENGILAIPGTPIQIPLADLFADLD